VALAASGAQLTAVERDEAASALAMRNLAARGLSAKVLTGNAADSPSKRFSRVVLDPPREGAEDAVGRIARVHRPDRIVYVSCDPRTLSRDIASAGSRGLPAGPRAGLRHVPADAPRRDRGAAHARRSDLKPGSDAS
jgi:tRNA/tmRNA/rRNA uracil-C5-methylase (TrmA/RlmC/RlmD family)